MKILSANLLHAKVKLQKRKKREDDIKVRFEYEGSYLMEYFMSFEDAVLIIKLNSGNMIYQAAGKYMVYSLPNRVTCIVST